MISKVAIIITLILFLGTVFAQEETGAVIRQLVQKVHEDMSNMESELTSLNNDKSWLTSELKSLSKRLDKSDDPEEQEQLAADMGVVLAKLNKLDRESVSIVKTNINKLRPSMRALKAEYEKAAKMGHASWYEFRQWRSEMGKMLSNSARLLQQLRSSLRTTDSESEIINVENTLILMFATLGKSIELNLDSGSLINEQMQILDDAYIQLHNIGVLLEQERLQLKMLTYSEIINAVLTYFSADEFSKVIDTPNLLFNDINDRGKTISTLTERSRGRINNDLHIESSADREKVLERLRSGTFNWDNKTNNN